MIGNAIKQYIKNIIEAQLNTSNFLDVFDVIDTNSKQLAKLNKRNYSLNFNW